MTPFQRAADQVDFYGTWGVIGFVIGCVVTAWIWHDRHHEAKAAEDDNRADLDDLCAALYFSHKPSDKRERGYMLLQREIGKIAPSSGRRYRVVLMGGSQDGRTDVTVGAGVRVFKLGTETYTRVVGGRDTDKRAVFAVAVDARADAVRKLVGVGA